MPGDHEGVGVPRGHPLKPVMPMLPRHDLFLRLAVLWATGALASAQDGITDLLGPATAYDLGTWSVVSGAWREQPTPWSKISAHEGVSILRPTAGDGPELEQFVDLTADGEPRPTHLLLRAWVRTGRGRDRAAVRLELFDRDDDIVAELDSGEQAATTWTPLVLPLRVPTTAVRARVTLRGVRNDGDFADALFDELALEDFGPQRPVGFHGLPTERLFALLDDGAPRVRRAAARALAVTFAAQRTLLERWRKEPDAVRRTELAIALALGAGSLASEPLQAMLGSRAADERELALTLLPLAAVDATGLLVPLIAAGNPAAVRRAALAAIVAQGGADGVRALQRLCRADPKDARLVIEVVRKSAASLDPFYRPLFVPVLDEDADAAARREAMRALGERGDPRFLIHFIRLAPRESSPDLLAQWFRWAAAIDGDRAISTILLLVDDQAPGAERAFLAASSKLRAKAALEWARRRGFASDNPSLRRAAIRLMASSTNPKDVQALRAATTDGEVLVAIEAVEVLTNRPGERVEDLLERLYTRAPRAIGRSRGGEIARVSTSWSLVSKWRAVQPCRSSAMRWSN